MLCGHHSPKLPPRLVNHSILYPPCIPVLVPFSAFLTRLQCTADVNPTSDSKSPSYQSLYEAVDCIDYSGLRYLVSSRREDFTNSFLCWLADKEKVATGKEKERLAVLCNTLLSLTTEIDAQQMAGQLPALASSLAYDNYNRWREDTGGSLPSPAKGASLETLYNYSENQEREVGGLLGGTSSFTSTSNKGGGSGMSTISPRMAAFLKSNSQYQDAAAAVISRTKMRMQALEGREDATAADILQEFVYHMYSREERCNCLPEAFTPPGFQIGPSSPGGPPRLVCTTPKSLLNAVSALARKHGGESEQSSRDSREATGGTDAEGGVDSQVCVGKDVRGVDTDGGEALPSGESLLDVLNELKEDIEEFDAKVYSRLSRFEQMGDYRPF